LDISGFEVKWGCSSRSDDPVNSVHNGNSSLKGLEISDFKNKQGCIKLADHKVIKRDVHRLD
jgi:hypothetical protein